MHFIVISSKPKINNSKYENSCINTHFFPYLCNIPLLISHHEPTQQFLILLINSANELSAHSPEAFDGVVLHM